MSRGNYKLKMKKLNVYVVTDAVNRKNGANGSLIDLGKALACLGINCTYVVMKRPAWIARIEAIANIMLGYKLTQKVISINCLANRFSSGNDVLPDIIYTIGSIDASALTMLRLLFPSAKIIYSKTSNIPVEPEKSKLFRDLLKNVDVVAIQSPHQLLRYKKLAHHYKIPDAYLVRPTIFEEKYRLGSDMPVVISKKNRVVLIGSIQPRKNQMLAVKAFYYIEKVLNDNNIILELIGPNVDDRYAKEIDKFIKAKNIRSVRTLGFVKNYHTYIQSADLVLMVSREEGLSTIIREALFCGKPILATRIDGNIGTLEHRVNSILVDVDIDPENLAQVIVSTLNDGSLLQELSISSKATYERFHSFSKYKEAIKNLIGTFE